MTANKLKLNDENAEAIICDSETSRLKVFVDSIHMGQSMISLSNTVRDPGFFLDKNLSMTYHISSVVRSNVFHLRCLGKLHQYLNEKLQMPLLCRLCCRGGTTANLFVGHTKEPATESKASPGHCCKNCHSNKEVRAHHFFFSLS